jgi:hypothetical protein
MKSSGSWKSLEKPSLWLQVSLAIPLNPPHHGINLSPLQVIL